MPYKRKDSPIWWASFADQNGKRVRQSTGTTDRKEAEALEAKWKVEAYRIKQWDEQPKRSFEELMVGYLKESANKRSANKDCQRTAPLRRHLGGRMVNDITAVDMRAYITMRRGDGVSDSTINRETALLSAAINHANREWDWDIPNPAKGRKLKEPEGRVRWLSLLEAEILTREAGKDRLAGLWLPEFIRLALNTGCRKNELTGLEWKRVDLHEGLIHLESHHTKAGKRRTIPLNRAAREAVLSRARFRAERCPDSPWVFCNARGDRIKNPRRGFESACKRAGIEDFNIHDLRHTCAAWLVTAGVPLAEVRDLLGHSTVAMTEKYAHLAPENIRAAVARLDGVSHSGHAVNFAVAAKAGKRPSSA